MNNRILIKKVYKNKLIILKEFGYKLGYENKNHDCRKFDNLSDKKKYKIIKKMNDKEYINFITNHIKLSYKNNIDIKNTKDINFLVDYSFYILRNIDEIITRNIY